MLSVEELRAQREHYLRLIALVDAMLAVHGDEAKNVLSYPTRPVRAGASEKERKRGRGGDTPQIVLTIVQQNPGLRSPEIVNLAHSIDASLKATSIHSALSRLTEDGFVRREGAARSGPLLLRRAQKVREVEAFASTSLARRPAVGSATALYMPCRERVLTHPLGSIPSPCIASSPAGPHAWKTARVSRLG